MTSKEKILLDLTFKENNDYSDFHLVISEKLKHLELSLRKKIIICSVELIQNNHKHNNGEMKIEIYAENENIFIESCQKVSDEKLLLIKNIIEKINTLSVPELKKLYRNNLTGCKENISTGNGLIICKLKSLNNIYIDTIKDKGINNLFIKLKFNYNG
ncbi:MAG: DUF6272 family protein [Bacteroidales bacterium]|jgi:hypothetical protein|nr:DUF6272 family protein [Bacteroidales bacterium]